MPCTVPVSSVHHMSASRRSVLRWLLGSTLAAGAPSLVLGCRLSNAPAAASSTPAPSSRDTVHWASDRNNAQAGAYLAAEQGYFAEQGLAVTYDRLTGPDLLTALAAGRVDAIGGPLSVGHWNAIARGVPLKIVAPMARQDPGASSTFLMVRKSLIDRGQFKDFPDLAGKKFAAAGSPNYSIIRTMEHAGLPPDAAEQVDLGQDFQAMMTGLSTGAIDVAWIAEPTATLCVNAGAAVKWRDAGDVFPGQLNVVLEFGADLLTHRTDVGQRWMTAYLKGVRDYYAAMVKKGSGWADVVSVLTRWTPVTDASLYPHMGFAYNDPNGQLNMDSLADQLRFAQDQGQLTGPLDVQQTVDTRFTDAAVQTLGRYTA